MKRYIFPYLFSFLLVAFTACEDDTPVDEEEKLEKEAEKIARENAEEYYASFEDVEGFPSAVAVASAVLNALENEDFEAYSKLVLPIEIIDEMGKSIQDTSARRKFLSEMDFSHEHERDYFRNLIKKLKNDHIKLDEIPLAEVDVVEFSEGQYRPVEVTAVYVDIITPEIEELLSIVAIKYKDKWYATAELEA